MGIEDNVKGDTAAFATFSPFKKWWGRFWELVVFKAFSECQQGSSRARVSSLCIFCQRPPRVNWSVQEFPDQRSLEHGALLFVSAYNGDPEIYFRGFSDKLHYNMNKLWEGCDDWKDAKNYGTSTFSSAATGVRSIPFSTVTAKARKAFAERFGVRVQLDELIAAATQPNG